MRTIGQILQEERLKKGFTYQQIEKVIKIRSKFLQWIEEDNFEKLPDSPYIEGFIKNYSEILGLRSSTILALFRRQYRQKKMLKKMLIEEPLTASKDQITPNKVILTLVIILVLVMFGYFYAQYQALHAPPPLKIESPTNEQVTKEEKIPVFGNTDKDATLTINNEPAVVKEDGKFYKDVPLTIGGNTLVIESVSRVGAKTSIVRIVNRTSN